MRWFDLYEHDTKDGRHIEVKRVEDSEGDNNRGWQIDELQAFVDGQEAGYLKLSYIPEERFAAHYPAGVFDFVHQIKGHIIFEYAGESRAERSIKHDFKTMTDDELRKFISTASWSFMHVSYGEMSGREGELEAMSRKELMAKILELKKVVTKRFGKEFEEFKSYFINKPLVDFIRVKDQFLRQGIATALYIEGAKWMAEKGMVVHASGLQQPEAAAAWAKMASLGWVKDAGKRRYLDPSKVR